MGLQLTDQVTIITGAASGIGRACAGLFAQQGSRLALVDVDEAGLASLSEDLARGEDVLTLVLSVASEQDMVAMVEQTLGRFGRIDNLVASAGILRLGEELKTVADMPLDEWRKVIDVNLHGTFLSNRAVLPTMLAQRKGDIVNVSSVSGRQGRAFDSAYSASKFGIIGLSESLHEEVVSQGVRVQTILPDAVDTPLWKQNPTGAIPPLYTLPPERVAEAILYMVALPRDAYLLNPVIAPVKTRKKRKKDPVQG